MANSLSHIKRPIAAELDAFEKRFRETMRSKVALMDRITYYIVKRKGKQMRPMFVFLSAKVCGEISDNSYVAASLIEILHTASLVPAACEAGAASTTAEEDTLQLMHQFGEKIGIAFQIKDDLFDFGTDKVGKPLGIDIKEKKMTLPLIHALNQADSGERRRIIRLIKKHSDKPEKVAEVIRFVHESEGLAYAEAAMLRYRDEAFELLRQMPESESRDSLEALVNYVVERKY